MATRTYTEKHVNKQRSSTAVSAGETTPWYMLEAGGDASVTVKPGATGTMSVQTTRSSPKVVKADNKNSTSNAIASTWTPGTVSAVTSADFYRITAIRFIATTAAGIGEIAE